MPSKIHAPLVALFLASVLSACSVGSSGSASSASAGTASSASGSGGTTSTTATPAGAVSLVAATYTASKGAASVTITRTGGSSGAASVSYTTINGTAAAGSDYTAVSGSVTWQNGDAAAKKVSIPITGKTGGKKFKLALSGANGATLTNPSSATITIAAPAPTTAPTPTPAPKPVPVPGTGNASLSIRVQGNHFIDAKSLPLQLRGVNAAGLEFTAVQGWSPSDPWGGVSPNWNAIKSWKSNAVRLPLNEASWLGYTCVDATGAKRNPDPGGNYQATVKKTVADATAAGLYVIVDLHWTAPSNFCPLAQNSMADADNSIRFWTSVATMFGGYPNVMFELFNEPFMFYMSNGEKPWSVLMQGGTMHQYVTGNASAYSVNHTWKVAGMQQMLNAIRATGATNVVLVAGVSWSQDLSEWVANKPKDPAGQMAAVWHAYPNSGTVGDLQAALPKFGSVGYTWTKSVLSAGYPVLITEFGDHNAPGTSDAPFVSNLLPWADSHGASYMGWTWDPWGDNDNVLIKDSSGIPTDGYGAYVKAHYLCVGAGNSNCL